jgi:hypothetical protein
LDTAKESPTDYRASARPYVAWVQEKLPLNRPPFIKPWMIDLADDNFELDITRARAVLGWAPRHSLRDTLPAMVAALKPASPQRTCKSLCQPGPFTSPGRRWRRIHDDDCAHEHLRFQTKWNAARSIVVELQRLRGPAIPSTGSLLQVS